MVGVSDLYSSVPTNLSLCRTAEFAGAPAAGAMAGHPAAGGQMFPGMQPAGMMRPQMAMQQGRPAQHPDPGLHPGRGVTDLTEWTELRS